MIYSRFLAFCEHYLSTFWYFEHYLSTFHLFSFCAFILISLFSFFSRKRPSRDIILLFDQLKHANWIKLVKGIVLVINHLNGSKNNILSLLRVLLVLNTKELLKMSDISTAIYRLLLQDHSEMVNNNYQSVLLAIAFQNKIGFRSK